MIQLNFYSGRPDHYPLDMAHSLARWESKLAGAFGGYTKVPTIGNWQGEVENSLLYIVVFSEIGYPTWEYMAKQAKLSLAEALGQTEVLVTWSECGVL